MNDRVWTSSKVPARTPGSTGARRSQVSASCRGNTAPRYHPIRCPHGRPAPFAGGSTRVGEARHHRTYCAGAGPHYLIGRYYDPATGQFLSVDPKVEQTLEAYAYAADDPVRDIDPEGETTIDDPGNLGIAQLTYKSFAGDLYLIGGWIDLAFNAFYASCKFFVLNESDPKYIGNIIQPVSWVTDPFVFGAREWHTRPFIYGSHLEHGDVIMVTIQLLAIGEDYAEGVIHHLIRFDED